MRRFELRVRVPHALLLAALTGCGAGAPGDRPLEPTASQEPSGTGTADRPTRADVAAGSWTVFVYGNGDSRRSPALTADIARMNEARLGSTVKVIVLADWDASMTDASGHYLYPSGSEWYALPGDAGTPTLFAREAEQDLEDPVVLRRAVARAFSENPAQHHALVIWSRTNEHRRGGDTQDGSRARPVAMSDAAMAHAIRAGLIDANLTDEHPLDVLGLDAAAPPRIETAFAMKDLAQVYIANASADGGSGWAYARALTFLADDAHATAVSFAELEATAWQTDVSSTPSAGALPRAHAAIRTDKLDHVARASSSLVQATAANPNALRHVASARYFAGTTPDGRERSYTDVVARIASGTNLGVVTAAAENAASHFAAASIGDAPSDFNVAMPLDAAMAASWATSYAASAGAWNEACGWSDLVRSLAAARIASSPSIDGSLSEPTPSSDTSDTPSHVAEVLIRIAGASEDLGFARASLFQRTEGNPTVAAYGFIGASAFDADRQTRIPWGRRLATVAGQPASASPWRSTTTLRGRVGIGHQSIDGAIVVLGDVSRVFVLEGEPIGAAEILAIDPAATFTPTVSHMLEEESAEAHGSPVPITPSGLPIGASELPAGNYEVHLEADDLWGNTVTIVRAYRSGP